MVTNLIQLEYVKSLSGIFSKAAVCQCLDRIPKWSTIVLLFLYTWKKVREHLLCYEGKLRTNIFLHSKNVVTKLFSYNRESSKLAI